LNYEYKIPKKIDDGWKTLSLTEEGIDLNKIEDLMNNILNGNFGNLQSLLIVKNGKLILEEYFGEYDRNKKQDLASVVKSIGSILIGIAMDKGFIEGIAQGGLEKNVLKLFPEHEGMINKNLRKQKILLKHILSMSAGLEWDEQTYSYDNPKNDWFKASHCDNSVKFVLQKPVIHPPGKQFLYNGGLTIMLSDLIKKNTRMDADEFAEKYLFTPLGIEDYYWRKIEDGLTDLDGGLSLRPRDMAKIGLLVLNKGVWKGKQIVSNEWIDESTKTHIETGILGSEYGYQWWRISGIFNDTKIETFFASGYGGQNIFIFPSLDMVITFTARHDNNPVINTIILQNFILPATFPPTPPRKTIPLNIQQCERYMGEYIPTHTTDTLRLIKEDNKLFMLIPDKEKIELYRETENQFWGTSKGVGDFQMTFFEEHEEIMYFIFQSGFFNLHYNKLK